MNLKEIKQLIKLVVDNDLTELNIDSGNTKVSMKRGGGEVGEVVVSRREPSRRAAAKAPPEAKTTEDAPADDLIEIKSPMVGTYYGSASPDSGSYVAVGDTVTAESVVCIVEAMKVMNEIKAELSGTVVEICAKNAQPVEFGQVLFRLKP